MFTVVVTYIYTQPRLTVNGVNMGNGASALNPVVEDFKLGQEMLSKQRKMEERGAKEHQAIYKFVMNINAQVCNTLSSFISNSALNIICY